MIPKASLVSKVIELWAYYSTPNLLLGDGVSLEEVGPGGVNQKRASISAS